MRSKCVVKVMLFVIIPVFMAIVPVAAYSQQGQEEAQAEITMQSENDSLATAKNDSAVVAQDLANMAEREKLGPILYNLKNSGIGEKYVKGGNFMHALLLASIVLFVFIIERFVTLLRARVNVRKLMNNVIKSMRSEGIEGAMRVCEGTKGPIAAVLHSGLLRSDRGPDAVKEAIETSGSIETSFLERGLVVIATVAQVAPLLGFLGTVSGMISAFASIAAAEQVSAKVVASGIEEALITTATGLIIAIPASIGHSYFVSQIDRFVLEMEEASAELVNELIESGRIEN
ncbi:MAG TPA: MotA/TolQ/ExbB proton channel family protein [Candidatus Krumholzibacteriaceae bacterium]|nr:MotA/TolQ/ExbB proton channel family protein [Candidatus Krumholzibacteriaceae bacterium]